MVWSEDKDLSTAWKYCSVAFQRMVGHAVTLACSLAHSSTRNPLSPDALTDALVHLSTHPPLQSSCLFASKLVPVIFYRFALSNTKLLRKAWRSKIFRDTTQNLLRVYTPLTGSVVGAVDKHSPQSHLCDPGSIPVLAVSCGLNMFLALVLRPGFFSGFPPSTKTNSKFKFDLGAGPQS